MQAEFDFTAPPPLSVARAMGAAGAMLAAERADRTDPTFTERARAFIVQYLQDHGTTSGEVITDAAKQAGLQPPDDRAFGVAYAGLARRGVIECAGFCLRRKGRGTAGGRLWRLA